MAGYVKEKRPTAGRAQAIVVVVVVVVVEA